MKNTLKVQFVRLFTIALVAVIGFTMAACDNGTTPSETHTHDWGDWTVTKAATCTAKGEETRVCTLDATHKETREIPIDPIAHVWGEWNAETEPTCTEKGKGSRVCTLNSSHKETGADIPALGHNYEWETTAYATCSAEGEETGTCRRDGTTTTRAIPVDSTVHDWVQLAGIAPTCTETGSGSRKCKICNTMETLVIPAFRHNYHYVITTHATCTTAGVETGTCTHDATHTTTRPIAAIGHDWGYWTQTKVATITEDGEEIRICSHNSLHKETRPVYSIGTPGLAFELINNNSAYRVRKGSADTSGAIYIPVYHRPNADAEYLPIMEIGSATDNYSSNAFGDTNITVVNIPASITTIGYAAFSGCRQLTDVNFANGSNLQIIDTSAFMNCQRLTSIGIPLSVTTIGGNAFASARISSIEIPANVTTIGLGALYVENSIIVNENNPNYSSQDGVLYNKTKTEIISFPSLKAGIFTIPDTVIIISDQAFNGKVNLEGLIIPLSVTKIGSAAFNSCWSISSIEIPESVASIGDFAFGNWYNTQTIYIKGYSSEAEADAAWNTPSNNWRSYCNATIVYNGS